MRKALYILGDLDDRDLIWLSENGAAKELAPGAALIKAGETSKDLYFVTNGSLAVQAPNGRQVATLHVGDVAGEMSFVEKSSPSVSVIALSPTRLLAVPRNALLVEFVQNPAFAARFYKALAVFLSDRLRTMTSRETGDEINTELDEGLLDNLHVAGDRMLRLIDLLEGRTQA